MNNWASFFLVCPEEWSRLFSLCKHRPGVRWLWLGGQTWWGRILGKDQNRCRTSQGNIIYPSNHHQKKTLYFDIISSNVDVSLWHTWLKHLFRYNLPVAYMHNLKLHNLRPWYPFWSHGGSVCTASNSKVHCSIREPKPKYETRVWLQLSVVSV